MLEYSKEDKDYNSNINPVHTTEAGRISGDYSDHEYSDEGSSEGGNDDSKGESQMLLFKVKKLGKKGITHKTRLLLITKEEICYYQMVEKNERTQKFTDLLSKIYRVIKNNEHDKEIQKKTLEAFLALPQSEKQKKASFKKYEIKELKEYDSFKIAPIKITNLDVSEQERLNPRNFWIMETLYPSFKKQIMDAQKNKLNSNENLLTDNNIEKSTKFLTNNIETKNGEENIENDKETKLIINDHKVIKDINETETTKKQKIKHILTEEKDKIHYIDIFFQGFIKEYYEHIYKCKKNKIKREKINDIDEKTRIEAEKKIKIENEKKQLYLELAIYYCYNLFVKHCEKVVKKIIADLATFKTNRDILKPGKLHPIVFPNPFSLTQENNSVLLYSVWGVNYTLTWNSLKGKFNEILTNSHGKWKGLKKSYKQKNCLQDLLTKISTVCSNINQFPSIPLNCMIDYNGFRVFCESDIFVDEEYLKGIELVPEEKTAFIRELTKYICDNNSEIEKEYSKQNNYCSIKNETIANDKALDFEKSIENILEDFEKSFYKKKGENKDLKFYKTEEKMINIIKNLNSDNTNNIIEEDEEDNFRQYFNETKNKQIKYQFSYLMNFNVSVPILNEAISLNNKNNKLYYRQEIFINNIDFDKYQKALEQEINKNNKKILLLNESQEEKEEENEKSQSNYISQESDEELNEEEDSQILSRNERYNEDNEISDENKSSKNEENEEEIENSKSRFLEIVSKNTFQNNPLIENSLFLKFRINFESLLIALDSFYLVPYNSETLKLCFHYYGINLGYLGKIAEKTTIPHIRELCLIEMFARVCKKIIFDLLAQKTFERATNAFYSNVKKILGNKYLIPFSFKVNYGGDYLTMTTLPIEDVKFLYYDGIELKGLYLQNDEYPFKDIEDDNQQNDKEINKKLYEDVLNFLKVLLGNNTTNNKLILYDTEIHNTKELWDFIINKIREQYNIINEDVFLYCNLDSISISSLISAIQYHTGIKQKKNDSGSILEKGVNPKYSRTISDEICINPKLSYNNFSYFLCKENIILPLANNFGMHFPGRRIYYQAKLNYQAEKYLYQKKISQNFYYLFYLKILKGWDTYDTKKASGASSINTNKEFNKNNVKPDTSNDQIDSLFEYNFETFIALILSQYQPKYQKGIKKSNQSLNKIDNNNLIKVCKNIISKNWNDKHPFISILYSTYAKALYKNTINREKENIINGYFFKATEIARDSLGELNIFYGKLTRDIGLFCEKNLKFTEAHKMFSFAFKVFNKHKNKFKKDYFYSLKHLTKNCVNLGQLEEGLNFGLQLVEEIVKEKPTLLDLNINGENINNLNDEEIQEILDKKYEYYFWNQIHNMDGFTFNLVKIAKYLGNYNAGVKLGNILFTIIEKISDNVVDYTFKNYKNWLKFSNERISDLNKIKNKQNNNNNEFQAKNEIKMKDYGAIKEKSIDNFIKLYLKCLFRGLKGVDNKVLARSYISFIENCKEPSLVNASKNQINDMFYKLFFRDNGETFEDHFKNKILYFLFKKYKVGSVNSVEIQKNYLISKYELEIIYFKFPKEECHLFNM